MRKTGPFEGSGQWWFSLVMAMLASCVLLFVLAPLVSLMVATPLSDLGDAAVDQEVLDSIKITLLAAMAATIISTVCGVPLGYILARKRFVGRSLVAAVVDLPIVIPHSAAGIALLLVIGRDSPMALLHEGGLVGTAAGIAVAMAFVSLPFLINAARQAFIAVPVRLEKAARTLGATPARVFFTISLPIAWRGIVSGMVLMWARGISEFGAVMIVAYHPRTTPVLLYQRFSEFGLKYARSVAVLLVLICVAVFVLLRLISRNKEPDSA